MNEPGILLIGEYINYKIMPAKRKITKRATTAKSKSAAPAKRKKTSTIVKITHSNRKSSAHILNLKNPSNKIFEANYSFSPPKNNSPISTPKPRQIPRAPKSAGVNFMSGARILDKITFKRAPEPGINTQIRDENELQPIPANNDIQLIDPFADGKIDDIFSQPLEVKFLSFSMPKNWTKKLAVFVLISFALVIPLQAFTYYQDLQETKDKILLITNQAIESLRSGQQSVSDLDLDLADLKFDEAKNNFALAQKQIEELNFLTEEILLLLPSKSKSVEAGVALLEAGQIIAESGQILINGGENFLNGNNLTDYYHSLAGFRTSLKEVVDKFDQAKAKIENINPKDLPDEHQETFTQILKILPKVRQGLTDLYVINDAMLRFLGHEQWQRYLIVFLNNNELRGSGGFMGSFGLLDIDRGEIKNFEIPGGGTYDLQGWLGPKVISPEPIHLINARWEFQDANWWADFPTTAKKIQWFHENSNGPSVDGVITITSTFVERLLEIIGPIPMEEYGRDEITSENFVEETQKIVQLEYDKEENKPKQFIADLTPKLLAKLFSTNKDQLKELFGLFKIGLNERHIMMYFNDKKTENLLADIGWAGEIRKTDGDYLAVIHTNLAGGKTDGVIKETIEHIAEVQNDGSIINTVKLTRRHAGIPGENIFTGVQNNSYVRFYVPAGSKLISAEGFNKPADDLFEQPAEDLRNDFDLISIETERTQHEASGTDIYKESGKTVFGNWLQLKAGEIQEASISYKLPFKLSLEGENTFYYSLLVQKQPGSIGSQLHSYLKLNDSLTPLAKFPATLSSDETGVSFSDILNIDRFYGVALYQE